MARLARADAVRVMVINRHSRTWRVGTALVAAGVYIYAMAAVVAVAKGFPET